jgi:hypothetical protein
MPAEMKNMANQHETLPYKKSTTKSLLSKISTTAASE